VEDSDSLIIRTLKNLINPKIFELLRKQLKEALELYNFKLKRVGRTINNQKYEFTHRIFSNIIYTTNLSALTCTCMMFEQMGYPCGHLLFALQNRFKQMDEIPIHDRWTLKYPIERGSEWQKYFASVNEATVEEITVIDTISQLSGVRENTVNLSAQMNTESLLKNTQDTHLNERKLKDENLILNPAIPDKSKRGPKVSEKRLLAWQDKAEKSNSKTRSQNTASKKKEENNTTGHKSKTNKKNSTKVAKGKRRGLSSPLESDIQDEEILKKGKRVKKNSKNTEKD